LNDRHKALENKLVWQCVSCYTCGTRCPNKIHVGRVTETLKKIAAEEKLKPLQHTVKNFHEAFSNSIKHMGRVNELEFMGLYELKNSIHYLRHMRFGALTREYMRQMLLGIRMISKKRMHFGIERIKDMGGDLKRLYRKAKEKHR
jgi:heterodisulfide reductase subunit C